MFAKNPFKNFCISSNLIVCLEHSCNLSIPFLHYFQIFLFIPANWVLENLSVYKKIVIVFIKSCWKYYLTNKPIFFCDSSFTHIYQNVGFVWKSKQDKVMSESTWNINEKNISAKRLTKTTKMNRKLFNEIIVMVTIVIKIYFWHLSL